MKLDLNNLPDDTNLLHTLIKDLAQVVDSNQSELRTQKQENKAHLILISELKRQLAALNRAKFGKRSEKLSPDQLALFEAELDENIAETKARIEALLPATSDITQTDIPNDDMTLDVDQVAHETETIDLNDKQCPDCEDTLTNIGTEEREVLEYRPATFVLRKIIRAKYACKTCESIVTAPLPCLPIEKGKPGPSLLAHVMVSKYQDHLPLDRQANINRLRHHVHTPTSTLADWIGRGSWALKPLYELMKVQLLGRDYIHTDDTPVKVMLKDKGSKEGRIWIYLAPKQANAPPIAVYDYTPHRKQTGPFNFLKGYEGYMQADAYPGYNIIYRGGKVVEVACWAHARRYRS